MGARTWYEIKSDEGFVYKWAIGETEVSNGDTVTVNGFDSAQNILKALLVKKNGGAEMTCTISNNVLTITGAGLNIDCFGFIYGYPA